MEQLNIGVMGCLPQLPNEFPIAYPENSGNMVHANAPFHLYKNSIFIKNEIYKAFGYPNFATFVNERCSHLVITLANTLKLGDEDGLKYSKMLDFLKKIEKPIVVFGLGIQAKNLKNGEEPKLPSSAIDLLRLLSQKSKLLGVRGHSTKKIIEELALINNVHVTGCPSIFSDIKSTYNVSNNLKENRGRPAFSGTKFFEKEEGQLLKSSIQSDHWLIEPVNRFNHEFYLEASVGEESYEKFPYFLKKYFGKDSLGDVANYYVRRYKLFRNITDWYQFNRDFVSYSYGSRFHVNMATLISGKPAVWITHDERTRELTDFMKLPSVSLEDVQDNYFEENVKIGLYDEFLDNFPKLVNNFNYYLEANGLPPVV